jgi:hypothetical protein
MRGPATAIPPRLPHLPPILRTSVTCPRVELPVRPSRKVSQSREAYAECIEFRLSPGPVRRPTLIATPPQAANAGDFGERRTSLVADTGMDSPDPRYSAVPSFVHEFPSPPEHDMSRHSSAFGQVVTGPPGAGKSTYCHGMHQVSRSPPSAH